MFGYLYIIIHEIGRGAGKRRGILLKRGKLMKKLVALLLAVLMCLTFAACGQNRDASIALIDEGVAPIMAEYGLTEYEIQISDSNRYAILCPAFEELSDGDKCDITKALVGVGDIEDQENEGETIRCSGNIYVEDDGLYYYYVNEAQAELSDRPSAGLYCSDTHGECHYED